MTTCALRYAGRLAALPGTECGKTRGVTIDLAGKQAFVTGGSGDIGRAICCKLASCGAEVSFSYFSDHEGAERTAQALAALQARAPRVLRVNFGDAPSSARFMEQARAQLESVDLLVSNAASGVFRSATDLSDRHFQWTMDVNARSLLSLAQGFTAERDGAAPLLSRGGAIVALSSLGAIRAIPQYMALGASKAALESIARHLALELGPRGIRVNVVSPGLVPTRALAHFPNRAHLLEVAGSRTPLARLATPEDVAGVVAFLCSDDAAMIHGQTIHVDGGYSIVG